MFNLKKYIQLQNPFQYCVQIKHYWTVVGDLLLKNSTEYYRRHGLETKCWLFDCWIFSYKTSWVFFEIREMRNRARTFSVKEHFKHTMCMWKPLYNEIILKRIKLESWEFRKKIYNYSEKGCGKSYGSYEEYPVAKFESYPTKLINYKR